MPDPTTIHDTFTLERHYPTPPARVFAAFATPTKKRRWYAEGDNHDIEMFEMDFRVGGAERLLYRFAADHALAGVALVNESTYQDIVPDRRIVTTSAMTVGGARISVALVTIELSPADGGTTLLLTHQAAFFEGSDGPRRREGGWHALLDKLATELTGRAEPAPKG
jgi:uncharacterized protein YndB with AHSA1/START domain